jgi:cob(I)alamin adenosyltransferase
MWYGSLVVRHGSSRPCFRYHASKRRRNRRRSGGGGIGEATGGFLFAFFVPFFVGLGLTGISYNLPVKLYTRTGDAGETSLYGGTRVRKDDARVDAYGEVDELNAWLGLARAHLAAPGSNPPPIDEALVQIQRDLFALGAELADPRHKIADRVTKATLGDGDVARLEGFIDRLEDDLPPLRRFILPGGGAAGAAFHIARTVCRRAERRMVALDPPIDAVLLRYVNRLSDLLFVLARAANLREGAAEIEW